MSWKDLVTDNTNTDLDLISIAGIVLVLTFVGLSVYSAIHPEYKFDAQGWAIGAAALLAGLGGGYKLKSNHPVDNDDDHK